MIFKTKFEKRRRLFTAGSADPQHTGIFYRTRGTDRATSTIRCSIYDAKVVSGEEVACSDPHNDGIYANGKVWYAV